MRLRANKLILMSLLTITVILLSPATLCVMVRTWEAKTIGNKSTPPVEDAVRNRWLNSVKCSPPCWEDINPGQTALQALENLKQLEFVSNIAIHEDPNTSIGEIEWDWTGSTKGGGRLFFHMGTDLSDGEVFAIWPEMGCCENLDKVISSFGEPDFAFTRKAPIIDGLTPQDPLSSYALIWIDKGFMVKGFPAEETQINEEFQIHTVIFFSPSWDGFIDFEGDAGSNAVAWHGYDDGLNYLVP